MTLVLTAFRKILLFPIFFINPSLEILKNGEEIS